MATPMSPERRALIRAHARQPMYLHLAEEEPNSAVAHRLELLDEVDRLEKLVAVQKAFAVGFAASRAAFPEPTERCAVRGLALGPDRGA